MRGRRGRAPAAPSGFFGFPEACSNGSSLAVRSVLMRVSGTIVKTEKEKKHGKHTEI
jgi:hypothetical protein